MAPADITNCGERNVARRISRRRSALAWSMFGSMSGFTHPMQGTSRDPQDRSRQGGLFRERIGVHAMGFGALHLSLSPRPPETAAINLILQVLDHGVRLIDTADCYCYDETDLHHNESLIFNALQQSPVARSQIIVATKGGLVRTGGRWIVDGNPDRLSFTIARSFEALGGATPIDLWQLHEPDPRYSISDTMNVLREAQNNGFIAKVGLSNVSLKEIQLAREKLDIVSIQNEYSPWVRSPERNGILQYCERENLVFLAWGPLGGQRRCRQLLTIPKLTAIAGEKRVTPYAVILAWLRAQSPTVVPLLGTKRIDHFLELLPAATLCLSDAEVTELSSAVAMLDRTR